MLVNNRANPMSHGKIILVLGAPGSGKGTICGRIVRDAEFNIVSGPCILHKSVGDVLRGLVSEGNLSTEQKLKVEKQELIGGVELAEILEGEVEKARASGHTLLLDGVPRNLEQLKAFDVKFGMVDLVIVLQCPRSISLQRYLGRHDPTRPDGDVQLFSKRFGEFQVENPKIIELYKRRMPHGVIEVDVGSTKSVDENYAKVKKLLKTSSASPWFEKAE